MQLRPHPVTRMATPLDSPAMPGLSIWGNASLTVRDLGNGQFTFQLRSRVNAPIMSGGPHAYSGDLPAAAKAILAQCSLEPSLRVDREASGFRVSLLDAQAVVLGQTDIIETEALVRAMIRLIVLQARGARVMLQQPSLAETIRQTA